MPYLQLNTSVSLSDAEKRSLCEEICKLISIIPGKSPAGTMLYINDGCFMEMGDGKGPCLNLVVRLLGAAPEENKINFIEQITALFERTLKVTPPLMYINLVELDDWGVDGKFRKA